MVNGTIYTRAYSKSNAGQLNSGRGPTGPPLSGVQLLAEFQRHANRNNRIPTALVSVSNRLVDTVHRAFQKHYVNGESPADIWVVFIESPAERQAPAVRLHSARELAQSLGLKPEHFHYEFVFEWGIPQGYVLHKVSLKTLMDRGLQIDLEDLSTQELRVSTARGFEQSSSYGPVDIGMNLGFFAKPFGARAPLDWIAHQWYSDSVRTWFDYGRDVVELRYAHEHCEAVEVDFFCDLDQRIGTVLMDWWLADSDFVRDYEDFQRWREAMEDNIADIEEEIEAEAVKIGL
ncbi:hypothetical protein F5144DRAFT_123770 [Chaetomium tenue]|uniref:Uncharacterized protein n=1 Tax=Chaetomium tenue TaxID=1854479 RepID=A0ACB7PH21_9PEZI|nr:hypothetical protein F5144DRAFT_123770 [Chaetomium globosum]